jgi:uncharacterized MAPEG superfamily protein
VNNNNKADANDNDGSEDMTTSLLANALPYTRQNQICTAGTMSRKEILKSVFFNYQVIEVIIMEQTLMGTLSGRVSVCAWQWATIAILIYSNLEYMSVAMIRVVWSYGS